jgi:NADP-dependent 3-hydroxy acid dehydrogenase YdfG
VGGQLAGRRVLVTGASSGIGEATARACAAEGAAVALLARRAGRLGVLADELGAVAVTADVRDPADAARGAEAAAEQLGGIDALVNNAGVARVGTIADGDVEDWRAMLDTNVLGLLAITKAAIPHLRAAERGDVVNVSSMSGRRVPGHRSAVYSGTKHAVHAISAALRRELHGDGIRVSLVSPGFVDTEIDQHDPDFEVPRDRSALPADAVARAISRILAEPPDVNVLEIALLPTAQET